MSKRTTNYYNLSAENKIRFDAYLDCLNTCKNMLEDTYTVYEGNVKPKELKLIKGVLEDVWFFLNEKKGTYGQELLEEQDFVENEAAVKLSETEVENDKFWKLEHLDF